MRNNIILLFLSLVMLSCNKEYINESNEKAIDYNQLNSFDSNDCNDSLSLDIATAIGRFYDGLAKSYTNDTLIFVKNTEIINSITDTTDMINYVNSFSEIYGMEQSVVDNYISTLINHHEYMQKEDNYQLLLSSLYCYANSDNSNGIENRWLFATLANIFDAGCGLTVAAGVLDTALLAAGTVALSTTGVGLAWGAVGTASSYANTIANGIDCFG